MDLSRNVSFGALSRVNKCLLTLFQDTRDTAALCSSHSLTGSHTSLPSLFLGWDEKKGDSGGFLPISVSVVSLGDVPSVVSASIGKPFPPLSPVLPCQESCHVSAPTWDLATSGCCSMISILFPSLGDSDFLSLRYPLLGFLTLTLLGSLVPDN